MQPKTQIYLLRHGQIEQSEPRRFIGQRDLPLTSVGESQARDMAQTLANIRFSRIFSSPLTRAVQTATIIAAEQTQPVTTIPELAEINLGSWEGLSVEEVRRRFPGQYEKRGKDLAHFRPPDGESFDDLAQRSFPCLTRLVINNPGPLLIVAHAGVNRVLVSRIQNLPLADLLLIPQDYCGLNSIRWEESCWHVDAINRRSLN
jgi:alpha-ribazole phosphatase